MKRKRKDADAEFDPFSDRLFDPPPRQPTPRTTPNSVPLTQSILAIWDLSSILRWCDLASAGVQPWELQVLPHHDLAKKHSLPK
jgi:hypothetical protein